MALIRHEPCFRLAAREVETNLELHLSNLPPHLGGEIAPPSPVSTATPQLEGPVAAHAFEWAQLQLTLVLTLTLPLPSP